jgi:hypothetical protein
MSKLIKFWMKYLCASESSFFDSDDHFGGIDDLLVGEATAMGRTEDEGTDIAQGESVVQGVPSGAVFTWDDLRYYIR